MMISDCFLLLILIVDDSRKRAAYSTYESSRLLHHVLLIISTMAVRVVGGVGEARGGKGLWGFLWALSADAIPLRQIFAAIT